MGLECAEVPGSATDTRDCFSALDCTRPDTSVGKCDCKRWWDGRGAPGFCELAVADTARPSLMEFWNLRKDRCHHNWSDERCALEHGEMNLYKLVRQEEFASADPTEVPECAEQLLEVFKVS